MATLGGWLAAALAGGVVLVLWRLSAARMESVVRACHELRGPLTAARLGLELNARAELPADRIRAIDLELGRAALVLEDLAEARIARRPGVGARLRDVDLRGLLADSVEASRATAARRGVRLRFRWLGDDGTMLADRLRLAQAVGNLIANAIEHGGGEVEVRGLARGEGARIEVIDAGDGLPAPLEQLLRRPDRARRRSGRSRGLVITREIVEAHGGRLSAAPTSHGARLVIELPCRG
jgi:signal transduction histidine kinase